MDISKFKSDLPFENVWQDKAPAPEYDSSDMPVKEMGYSRSYIRNREWYTRFFRVRSANETPERIAELEALTAWLHKHCPSLGSLKDFLLEVGSQTNDPTEFNTYYAGEHLNFWVRGIIRENDYCLYIHGYVKEAN